MRILITSLSAIAIALTACSGAAFARPKHTAASRPAPSTVATTVDEQGDLSQIPLTVNRRSWLDPGPIAPRGRGQAYVTANTINNRTQDRIQNPGLYGNSEIVGPPYVPGRSQPVVEFSTLPDGRVDIANELLPQNFYLNPAPSVPPPAYRPSFSLEQP